MEKVKQEKEELQGNLIAMLGLAGGGASTRKAGAKSREEKQ